MTSKALSSKPSNVATLVFFGCLLFASPARAWFAEGHESVAIIAADDLTPAARSHVAQILGVPADTGSVAKAMLAAAIRPDTEFAIKIGPQGLGVSSISAFTTRKQ